MTDTPKVPWIEEMVAKRFRDTGSRFDSLRVSRDAELAFAVRVAARALEEAETMVPGNWLDPMLSGDSRVIMDVDCNRDIEAVLNATRDRLRARAAELRGTT